MNKLIILFLFIVTTFSSLYGNKVIAISYFDNTTANSKYNSLSKGIADMLITDLSKVRDIDIVEREKLEKLIKEIKLGQSKYFDQSTAQKLGKGLGAASILTGAFYVLDGVIRIDARLINVESGKVMAADEVTGKTSDFFSLHKQLVNLLTQSLRITNKTKSIFDYDNKIELKAVVNYSDAITYEDNGLDESATKLLESTLQEYPEFLFAQTKLDKIRAFIIEKEKEREQLLLQELNTFLSNIDPSSKTFSRDVMAIWANMLTNFNFSSILAFNNQLRKNNVPFDKPAYEGSNVTLGEYVLYYDCMAYNSLKRHQKTITNSKSFLELYPTSMYFNSVKMNLTNTLNSLEKIEEGKKNLASTLPYNEYQTFLKFINSLDYHPHNKFNRGKNYKELKKKYNKKIINGDVKILKKFIVNDEFDLLFDFFEVSEKNLDIEFMTTIKDLAEKLVRNTNLEEEIEDLEDDIYDLQEKLEKHQEKKTKALEELNSNDIEKKGHAVKWFWLMNKFHEEDFIIKWSVEYLDLKDNRDEWKVIDTRIRAYENIINAYDRLGNVDKVDEYFQLFKNDKFLIETNDKDYTKELRSLNSLLKSANKDKKEFEKFVLVNNYKSNLLISNASTYSDSHQYIEEIKSRKELLDNYELDIDVKQLQHYLLYTAYGKAGLFQEQIKCGKDYLKEFPKSSYSESIKTMLPYIPK